MAKQQEVATKADNALPAYLQGMQKQHKIGNIDKSDLIIPRVKLLQAISPELDANTEAKKGEFWHNVAEQSLGKTLRAIPILTRKSFVLWAPRGDDRGVLARANDGVHWDQPAGMKFTVKPKGSPRDITYELGETVHDRVGGFPALSEFGSAIPGDNNSPPAAALTYQFLWFFPDFADMSPAVIINTRSSIKPAKALLSKIDQRPVEHYAQAYQIGIVQQQGAEGPFFNYVYTADGYASEDEFKHCETLFKHYRDASWRADDESEDTDGDKMDESNPTQRPMSKKAASGDVSF